MKRIFKLIFLMAVFGFFSCLPEEAPEKEKKGDDDEVVAFVGVHPMGFMSDLGMTFNYGNIPPNIEGTFKFSPVLEHSNISTDEVGTRYQDMTFTFYDQDNSELFIQFEMLNGMTLKGMGEGAFITGSGNSFSVYLKVDSSRGTERAESIMVISGTMTSNGIANFRLALFMVDNYGNNFMQNGGGRIFRGMEQTVRKTHSEIDYVNELEMLIEK